MMGRKAVYPKCASAVSQSSVLKVRISTHGALHRIALTSANESEDSLIKFTAATICSCICSVSARGRTWLRGRNGHNSLLMEICRRSILSVGVHVCLVVPLQHGGRE